VLEAQRDLDVAGKLAAAVGIGVFHGIRLASPEVFERHVKSVSPKSPHTCSLPDDQPKILLDNSFGAGKVGRSRAFPMPPAHDMALVEYPLTEA
jgi:hypothetical protein